MNEIAKKDAAKLPLASWRRNRPEVLHIIALSLGFLGEICCLDLMTSSFGFLPLPGRGGPESAREIGGKAAGVAIK
jgi:hypothetical protein